MRKEFNDKLAYIKTSLEGFNGNGGMSFYRFFLFVTSYKGQKRILFFGYKVVRYFFRKLTGYKPKFDSEYAKWLDLNYPQISDLSVLQQQAKQFTYQPLVSIVMPVYNPNANYLQQAIQSVINQAYTNWQLCIADDASNNEDVKKILTEYENHPKINIVYRKTNGHISAASNDALQIVKGEYVAFLDHDDCLSIDALLENVKVLNNDKTIDLLYSDEDKIDNDGNHAQPYFKPNWSPESFLARNYLGHFVVIKSSLLQTTGGFKVGYEGAQDYDLLLRVTEIANNIYHIPKILYHWRIHQNSTSINETAKPYAFNAGIKALQDAIERRNIAGEVLLIENLPGFYHIDYRIINPEKVTVIIPTKNRHTLCETVVSSIFKLTNYPSFEVILIDNNSSEPDFFTWVETWKNREPNRFKCITDSGDFNFSRLINLGAKNANGKYLLLLNNDTEVLEESWMSNMVKTAQFDDIGVVGPKLLYPNNTIQHAGVIIGLGGIAGHTFVGFERNASGYFHYLKCVNNYSALTAACIMVRTEVFNKVGGFNEDLAIEFNDIDFCLQVVKHGYRNVYLPHVTLYHYESISRGHPHRNKKSYAQHLKDVNYFKNRWQNYISNDPCYSPHLSLIFTDFRLNVND